MYISCNLTSNEHDIFYKIKYLQNDKFVKYIFDPQAQ
jgi:hypothetical protein